MISFRAMCPARLPEKDQVKFALAAKETSFAGAAISLRSAFPNCLALLPPRGEDGVISVHEIARDGASGPLGRYGRCIGRLVA